MKKLSLPILVLMLTSQAGNLAVHSGVYNKLKQINVSPEQYFDSEDVSAEEKSLQEMANKASQEKLAKEAEAKAKETEVMKKAQDIREQEINLLNEKFQAEKEDAPIAKATESSKKKKSSFLSKVWKVISYPFRAVARVF